MIFELENLLGKVKRLKNGDIINSFVNSDNEIKSLEIAIDVIKEKMAKEGLK